MTLPARALLTIVLCLGLTAYGENPNRFTFQGFNADDNNSRVLDGYTNTDSIKARLSALPLTKLEGIWMTPADGSMVVIERTGEPLQQVYAIVSVLAGNRSIPPGTVLGTLRPTGKALTYEARIFSVLNEGRGTLSAPKDYISRLEDDGTRLVFESVRKGVVINPWRLMPRMFRYLLRWEDRTPQNLGGFRKVFPNDIPAPDEILWL